MTIGSLTSTEQTTALKEVFATDDVRTLVANHLGISVGRVTDEAHFTHDLGADWLDRLELMMAVEDQFAGVEITDGDLVRFQCPHCGVKHETKVERLASRPLSLEPPQMKRTRDQQLAQLLARVR